MNIKCKKCGVDYDKPDNYKKWNESHPNIFFKMSLEMCDACRRGKEREYLKGLGKVINSLG